MLPTLCDISCNNTPVLTYRCVLVWVEYRPRGVTVATWGTGAPHFGHSDRYVWLGDTFFPGLMYSPEDRRRSRMTDQISYMSLSISGATRVTV